MTSASRPLDLREEPSDATLLAALEAGHISALGTLYDRHRASVHRFIARLTNDAPDVEDLVQATFLTATKAAGSFDGRASCRPWLLGVAARLVNRRRRSLGRLARTLREFALRERGQHAHPERALDARNELAHLGAAIAGLSEGKRSVLLLAEVEGLGCEDIARALGVPVGTVWRRLHQARAELRAALKVKR